MDYDDGFNDFLVDLLNSGALSGDDKVEGITKLVINKGINSLSHKQRYVFTKYVIDEFTLEECAGCGGNIPWSEMLDAYEEGGLCSWCLKRKEQIDKA